MNGLILETSCNRAGILLAREGVLVKSLFLSGGAELSKNLGSATDEFLEGSRCDYVAVGMGPGSYTGVRVGGALAQSLAFGWQVPILGFCSLYAFFPSLDRSCAVLFDARGGGFYCQRWGEEVRRFTLEQAKRELAGVTLFSPHPELIQQRWDVSVAEVGINSVLIASYCYENLSSKGGSFLEPLPFIYP